MSRRTNHGITITKSLLCITYLIVFSSYNGALYKSCILFYFDVFSLLGTYIALNSYPASTTLSFDYEGNLDRRGVPYFSLTI